MKIVIDQDGCIECGSCEATCPEIFVLPEGEKSCVVAKFRKDSKPAEGEISEDLSNCAKDAADSCPVSVISLQ